MGDNLGLCYGTKTVAVNFSKISKKEGFFTALTEEIGKMLAK